MLTYERASGRVEIVTTFENTDSGISPDLRNQANNNKLLTTEKQKKLCKASVTEKWPPKIGQRDKCLPGSSRHPGSRFVVDAVRRAQVKRLVPPIGIVEGDIPVR